MTPRLMVAYDGSASAATAVRAVGTLFPEARAAIVTVPSTTAPEATAASRWMINVGTEVVQQALDEIAAEAGEQAHAIAAEGVARANAAGLKAEIALARRSPHLGGAALGRA